MKKKWHDHLNEEDIATVILYTEELKLKFSVTMYRVINLILNQRNEAMIMQAGPYIISLLLAIRKLNPYEGGKILSRE